MSDTFAPTGPGYYRTRGGEKVRVVEIARDIKTAYPVVAILCGDVETYAADGRSYCGDDAEFDDDDIIAPWTDPPVLPFGWRWIGRSEPMRKGDVFGTAEGDDPAVEVDGLDGQTLDDHPSIAWCRRRIAPSFTITIPGSTPDAVTVNGETYRRAT